jgi:hypothetical protein
MNKSLAVLLDRGTIPYAVRVLLLTDLPLAALYILDTALGHPYSIVTRLVNLNGEANLPTWYSSAQSLVLGLLLGALAVVLSNGRLIRSWPLVALSAVCLALSLDETAQIHEWFGKKSDILFASGTRQGSLLPRTGLWMFLLGPPFVIVVALLWRALSRSLRGRERVVRLYLVGFFLYVTSALGMEIFANVVSAGGRKSVVQVACEELGELLGVTLLIWATLELLASYDIHVRIGNHRVTYEMSRGKVNGAA